ncbi:MAG: lysylphosphatidylglycerol synthase transmembrane domain-containing protein [Solirubrobacterales bacterium]
MEKASAEKAFVGRRPPGDPSRASAREGGGLQVLTARRIAQTLAIVVVLIAAIYFLVPKLVGLGDVMSTLGDAEAGWVVVAIAFELAAFGTYVALFRGVVGGDVLPLTWAEAYQINMAGLAATRLFSAGGAGGIALTYWALRRAGMPTRESAKRMVTFLALQYIWYPIALIVCGVLLRTGVLSGESSVEVTIVPAAVAAIGIVLAIAIALIPGDLERRIARFAEGHRRAGLARRLASVSATLAAGLRGAFDLVAHPSRGGLAVAGAIGFWAANIAILWASFRAFGVTVPIGVLVQGFFLGMVANLFPFAPGGVGAVDAGMIGAFLIFGVPEREVFASVLVYRAIAFWLPIPPGVLAFFQLRSTVARWEAEGRPAETGEEGLVPAPASGPAG